MQDRYAGDVGDFGKFAVLRALAASTSPVGSGDRQRRCDSQRVATVRTDMAFDQYREREPGLNGDIILGIILIVIGIAITAITHESASRQGGTYIIAFGPIIVGVIRLIKGLARSSG